MQSPSRTESEDSTAEFMTDLGNRGFEPLMAHITGTIGIDLTEPSGTQHWHVDVDQGRLKVSHQAGDEDACIFTSHELFDSAALGRANLWTAMLRGSIDVRGDLHLVALFQRLFPGPGPAAEKANAEPSR